MPIENRTVSMTGVFAENAITPPTTPPVAGVSYRDTSLTKEEIEQGWPYKEIVDSSKFNEYHYELSKLVKLQETYGFMPWSNLTDYETGSVCLGTDGNLYQAKEDTGPSSTAYDPVYDEEHDHWKLITVGTDKVIGQIIQVACASDYVPDGCLPCNGQEYAKAQFNDLWDSFLITGKLVTCTYSQYANEIEAYGQCAKFGVDTETNKFKVPTIKDGSYITQANSNNELGKSYNESLPNAKGHFYALDQIGSYSGIVYRAGTSSGGYGGGGTYDYRKDVIDLSRASSAYQDNAPVQGNNVRYRFFVVVANGQINQSQMDWSAWASALSGKVDKDSSWGIPDYTAGIALSGWTTSNTYFTTPKDGVVYVKIVAVSGLETFYIDDIAMSSLSNASTYTGTAVGFISLKKGQHTWRTSSTASRVNSVIFYPFQGA